MENKTPNIVYKYRDFNNEKHLRIITHQEIYFAKPSEFGYSYDCIFKIDKEYIKDERNRRIFYANKLGTKNILHPRINELIKKNQITDEQIEIQENESQKVINDNYGIFSVSRNYRNSQLWEKFGGNHKGFCVGLSFQDVLPMSDGTKGKVKYKNKRELPKNKVFNYKNELEIIEYVLDSILTLPIELIDEQEYRMQKFISTNSDRYKVLAKKYIKIIVLGYKISSSKRELITELIKIHLPEVKLKRLKFQNGKIVEQKIN